MYSLKLCFAVGFAVRAELFYVGLFSDLGAELDGPFFEAAANFEVEVLCG